MPYLSIIIPVFNEASNLNKLASELLHVLSTLERSFEIIFVDDGSTDTSNSIIQSLKRTDTRIRLITLSDNCGQSAAFHTGFNAALGDVCITMDADRQNVPHDIPRLLEWYPQFDMVIGIRNNRCDSPIKRISSRIANMVRNCITAENIVDTGCSLKCIRTGYARKLPAFQGMHRFMPTLAGLYGASIKQIPVSHRPRLSGTSHYGIWNRIFVGIVDSLGVRWLKSRGIDFSIERTEQ